MRTEFPFGSRAGQARHDRKTGRMTIHYYADQRTEWSKLNNKTAACGYELVDVVGHTDPPWVPCVQCLAALP